MTKLNEKELTMVNGGNIVTEVIEAYEAVRDFVNNNLGDLVQGIKDGWNEAKANDND
ncbi:MAG: hypothetical protein K6F63_02100 [Lachnospiraceae bacterium]|nr:hypothetical protein [Lachnospiraceae bacterium]